MSDAPDREGPGTPRLQEVSDDVYAYIQPDGSWWINNTGFLVGRRGVISVDSCSTERRTRAYLDGDPAVTDRPVRTLVNTHHHGDHTFGNYLFPGATIVGHERTRASDARLGHAVRPSRSGRRSTGATSSSSRRSSPTPTA